MQIYYEPIKPVLRVIIIFTIHSKKLFDIKINSENFSWLCLDLSKY